MRVLCTIAVVVYAMGQQVAEASALRLRLGEATAMNMSAAATFRARETLEAQYQRESCLHLSIPTGTPSLNVLVTLRGAFSESITDMRRTSYDRICTPKRREFEIDMHVGVQIKLLVGSLSLAVRSTVTCFSEDAPGYFVMLKQTIFNLMSRGTPIGRFKRFQPNNEVMGDEGEVRESPDDPTIAADPFEEAEDIAFEESLKGFNDGEQVRKQQQQKLVKDTLAGLRAELKRKGKEPQGGASVWGAWKPFMQRSLAAARVKVAVDVSNFVADFGKRFFCWGAPNFAGKYEPTACLRAAVQGLLDNSGLRKSKEREEVIKMIRTDSKFKNNVGRGIANIVTGGSSSIPVEEGIIDAVKHGIKMIAHAVSKATLLHVYGYSGERGGILRWKSTAKGFGSFVCDSLNVMDSVTLRTAELHLIDPTIKGQFEPRGETLMIPAKLLCSIVTSHPYSRFTDGMIAMQDPRDDHGRLSPTLAIPFLTAPTGCTTMSEMAALASKEGKKTLCDGTSLELGAAAANPDCSVFTPPSVANLFPKYYSNLFYTYENIDITTDNRICPRGGDDSAQSSSTNRVRAAMMALDKLELFVRKYLHPVDPANVFDGKNVRLAERPWAQDWTFRELTGFTTEAVSRVEKDVPEFAPSTQASASTLAAASPSSRIRGALKRQNDECAIYEPKTPDVFERVTTAVQSAPSLSRREELVRTRSCLSSYSSDVVEAPDAPPLIALADGHEPGTCGWIVDMNNFEDGNIESLTQAQMQRTGVMMRKDNSYTLDMDYSLSVVAQVDFGTISGGSDFCSDTPAGASNLRVEGGIMFRSRLLVIEGVWSRRVSYKTALFLNAGGNPVASLPGFAGFYGGIELVWRRNLRVVISGHIPLLDLWPQETGETDTHELADGGTSEEAATEGVSVQENAAKGLAEVLPGGVELFSSVAVVAEKAMVLATEKIASVLGRRLNSFAGVEQSALLGQQERYGVAANGVQNNFYSVLGVSASANPADITGAYNQRYANEKTEEGKKRVQEAYDTLKDPGRRSDYDMSLRVTCSVSSEQAEQARQRLLNALPADKRAATRGASSPVADSPVDAADVEALGAANPDGMKTEGKKAKEKTRSGGVASAMKHFFTSTIRSLATGGAEYGLAAAAKGNSIVGINTGHTTAAINFEITLDRKRKMDGGVVWVLSQQHTNAELELLKTRSLAISVPGGPDISAYDAFGYVFAYTYLKKTGASVGANPAAPPPPISPPSSVSSAQPQPSGGAALGSQSVPAANPQGASGRVDTGGAPVQPLGGPASGSQSVPATNPQGTPSVAGPVEHSASRKGASRGSMSPPRL